MKKPRTQTCHLRARGTRDYQSLAVSKITYNPFKARANSDNCDNKSPSCQIMNVTTSFKSRHVTSELDSSTRSENFQIPNEKLLLKIPKRVSSAGDLQKLKERNKRRLSSCYPLNSSKVCFGTVSVVEFPVTIGDSPEVPKGCPVALSPVACRQINDIPVQTYECFRDSSDKAISRNDWRLTSGQRRERLLSAGYSQADINNASKEAYRSRLRRDRLNRLVHLDGVHSLMEKTTRGLIKVLFPSAAFKPMRTRSMALLSLSSHCAVATRSA